MKEIIKQIRYIIAEQFIGWAFDIMPVGEEKLRFAMFIKIAFGKANSLKVKGELPSKGGKGKE